MNSNFRWLAVAALIAPAFLPIRASAVHASGNRVTSVQGARAPARNVTPPSLHGSLMRSVNHQHSMPAVQNFNGAGGWRWGSGVRPPQRFDGCNLGYDRPAAASGTIE